ncbi:hypothetical protein TrVFT333_004509 [Trichoderma virens FT-333]|nr:hypothetical protein TrVFT333_004509 [Trichoderma virens FT-333]
MGLEHMHAMISNMMLFQTSEIRFGDKFFANGGFPESLRPQLERGNGRFRFLVIFPMKKDGGVELVMGTHPEELEMLMTDEEFTNRQRQVMRSSSPASIIRQPQTKPQNALFNDENVNLLDSFRDSNDHNNLNDIYDNEESTAHSDIHSNIKDNETVIVPWTSKTLIFAYIMIWFTYFVEGILSATTGILTPYVTSDFASHSLTPTVNILSSVIGGVTNLTLAKILDIFGRAYGYLFCIILATSGLVMMSTCNSIQAYAIAQVFQTIGNNGILYSLTVFVADNSSMRNRDL